MSTPQGSLTGGEWPSLFALVDGRDRFYWRRLAIAFAAAIAFHEIMAAFVRPPAEEKPEQPPVTQIITISIRTPAPTPPPPTPRPTPAKVTTFAPKASLAQAAPRAAAPVNKRLGGKAAKRKARVKPPPIVHASPKPIIALATAGAGAGVQNGGTGAGAGAGTSGEGGLAGTGSGMSGAGTGAGAGVRPCGEVWMQPVERREQDGHMWRKIRLEVILSDGSKVDDVLGWWFYYPNANADPFTAQGEKRGAIPLLQLPPPGYDLVGRQNAATVFAVKHTDRAGFTDLEDCPQPYIPPR